MSEDDTFSRSSFMLPEWSPFKKAENKTKKSELFKRPQIDTTPSEVETDSSLDLGYLSCEAYSEARQ